MDTCTIINPYRILRPEKVITTKVVTCYSEMFCLDTSKGRKEVASSRSLIMHTIDWELSFSHGNNLPHAFWKIFIPYSTSERKCYRTYRLLINIKRLDTRNIKVIILGAQFGTNLFYTTIITETLKRLG
jgi:hypothetical protein